MPGSAISTGSQAGSARSSSCRKAAPTQTIVVAALPLKFGVEVTRQHLREIAWPEGSVPRGAFAKIDELLDGKTRRVALAALEENEPVLKAKVTGPGQRGSLAAVIQQGMKAVTVRVNDINGVAGFVLPGERVDVLLVRNLERTEAYSDVLLQNVKVLAVDQLADESSDKPALVKAVTVFASAPAEEGPRSRMVGVSRGMKRQEYSVPVYGGPARPETHTASTVPPKS